MCDKCERFLYIGVWFGLCGYLNSGVMFSYGFNSELLEHVKSRAGFPRCQEGSMTPYDKHPTPCDLCQLLLDEERPEVRQLPRANDPQNRQLNQRPSNHSRIRSLGLISELRLALLNSVSAARPNRPPELTRWNTCSRLMSCSRPCSSRTLPTIS